MSRPEPPFRRILVANRGEIAVRIMRTCRELGIETVAVFSDPDADAFHVRLADQAVHIGPAAASLSYLHADRIVEAARQAGAEAIHPGYGFLSEQAAFAQAVEAAGLTFVGPAPGTLAALGDKLAARRSARAAEVPVVPGMFEALRVDSTGAADRLERLAVEIGFPLLVKAAAGGGGRGMRRVDDAARLAAAVDAAAREAEQAFGDDSVYLERLVEGGRHIEVQLLGDAHGAVVALGERDCSTQRRHQKLVEEAPAPALSGAQRRQLHQLAVRVAQGVGLRNAATAEFLYAPDGAFYFLEVNARLQVEHGVTELLTGLDLVREQLQVAAGAPLSEGVHAAAVRAAMPDGHALELRISAEDPARDFAPVPGRVTRWREPAGPGVRVDSGIEAGSLVPPDYDPLLAKVLVVAPDRDSALARARRAIGEFETGGVQTTLPFHAWLLRHPEFVEARLRTDMVARDWAPAALRGSAARQAAEAVARLVWASEATSVVRTAPPTHGATGPPVAAGATGPPVAVRAVSDGGDGWRDAGRRDAIERWP